VNPYRKLFQALNDADIRYLVVGGVAVNLHGYSRFTGDVDIVMALDTENLDRMGKLMKTHGFTQRLPIDVRQLSDRAKVQQWLVEKGMTAYTFIDPKMPQFSIDILAGESLRFDAYDKNRVLLKAWEVEIPVVSVDDLIGMKKKANRTKDIEDVAALLELKSL
jgi:hypothetical protein